MPLLIDPTSPYSHELAKWEQFPTPHCPQPLKWGEGGKMGMPFQEFPKMLYKAEHIMGRGTQITDHQIVNDASEELLANGQGYFFGQLAALEKCKAREKEMAELAANRAYHEQRMSPAAQAEAVAAQGDRIAHLAEIPEKPIRRRGRKPKVQVESQPS